MMYLAFLGIVGLTSALPIILLYAVSATTAAFILTDYRWRLVAAVVAGFFLGGIFPLTSLVIQWMTSGIEGAVVTLSALVFSSAAVLHTINAPNPNI